MGGKIIIEHGVTLRGDLHREGSKSPIIAIGRYCILDANCTVTPPRKKSSSTGQDTNYPVKIGSYVHIGQNSSVQAASIGNCVDIGKNCSVGMFSIIKDCVKIDDDAVIPPFSVIASFSHVKGSPPNQITSELPESADQLIELSLRKMYAGIHVPDIF
jgi:dynactin-5